MKLFISQMRVTINETMDYSENWTEKKYREMDRNTVSRNEQKYCIEKWTELLYREMDRNTVGKNASNTVSDKE